MRKMHLMHENGCLGTGRARRLVLAAALLLIVVSGCGTPAYESVGTHEDGLYTASSRTEVLKAEKEDSGENVKSEQEHDSESIVSTICVYVCGAVHTPGVYSFPAGARVYQAISAAGGLTADAESRMINQARELLDGEQITVPTVTEAASSAPLAAADPQGGTAVSAGSGATPGLSSDGKVNINTADSATLQTLKGIGASRAEEIIAYREGNGSFSCIEDIMKVSGIKTGLFEKIKDQITVG